MAKGKVTNMKDTTQDVNVITVYRFKKGIEFIDINGRKYTEEELTAKTVELLSGIIPNFQKKYLSIKKQKLNNG